MHLTASQIAAMQAGGVPTPQSSQAQSARPRPRPQTVPQVSANVPDVMLAERLVNVHVDPTGWYASEKLDGVRAYWDGEKLISRLGNVFRAPAWFTAGLPRTPLDGELWPGRGMFHKVNGWVKRHNDPDVWKRIRYLCFDAPHGDGDFERRQMALHMEVQMASVSWLYAVEQERVASMHDLMDRLKKIEKVGGEGLMIRKPGSAYEWGTRSMSMLKVTTRQTAEAEVIGYNPGTVGGSLEGLVGSLRCVLPNGIEFSVGTGMKHSDCENPPSIGATITFGYKSLTKTGVPREPSYYRVRSDV